VGVRCLFEIEGFRKTQVMDLMFCLEGKSTILRCLTQRQNLGSAMPDKKIKAFLSIYLRRNTADKVATAAGTVKLKWRATKPSTA
jgi:hypothetical protein